MQTDMSYLRPLIPSINSFGLCELEEEKLTKIKELNEEETIWLAIESIKEGAKKGMVQKRSKTGNTKRSRSCLLMG